MSLVTYLEERYDIQVELAAVTTEHFATVRTIAEFVESNLNRSASV
jgi:acyl carrier protein